MQKWRQKQQPKKHSFWLLIAIAFIYHHYEQVLVADGPNQAHHY